MTGIDCHSREFERKLQVIVSLCCKCHSGWSSPVDGRQWMPEIWTLLLVHWHIKFMRYSTTRNPSDSSCSVSGAAHLAADSQARRQFNARNGRSSCTTVFDSQHWGNYSQHHSINYYYYICFCTKTHKQPAECLHWLLFSGGWQTGSSIMDRNFWADPFFRFGVCFWSGWTETINKRASEWENNVERTRKTYERTE